MGLELIELVPIFMVFILYFLGMPIVYALFGSTFFYFTFIDTTSKNWLILQIFARAVNCELRIRDNPVARPQQYDAHPH